MTDADAALSEGAGQRHRKCCRRSRLPPYKLPSLSLANPIPTKQHQSDTLRNSLIAMPPLLAPSEAFVSKKAKILEQLNVPDESYTDLSPKGSVDVSIRDLIAEVNAVDGLVTTSSCGGRVSVFLEGIKREDGGRDGQVATPGGKGAGGAWLFVSHDPVKDGQEETEDWSKVFGFNESGEKGESDRKRMIHFKFEPMVSVLTPGVKLKSGERLTSNRSCTSIRLHQTTHN